MDVAGVTDIVDVTDVTDIRDTSLTTGGGGLKNRGNFTPEILRSPLSNRYFIL